MGKVALVAKLDRKMRHSVPNYRRSGALKSHACKALANLARELALGAETGHFPLLRM